MTTLVCAGCRGFLVVRTRADGSPAEPFTGAHVLAIGREQGWHVEGVRMWCQACTKAGSPSTGGGG